MASKTTKRARDAASPRVKAPEDTTRYVVRDFDRVLIYGPGDGVTLDEAKHLSQGLVADNYIDKVPEAIVSE